LQGTKFGPKGEKKSKLILPNQRERVCQAGGQHRKTKWDAWWPRLGKKAGFRKSPSIPKSETKQRVSFWGGGTEICRCDTGKKMEIRTTITSKKSGLKAA